MIISHKHQFIFIKTRKTAGTSVEVALSKLCGPMDILTPIAEEDELKRVPIGPQNYMRIFHDVASDGRVGSEIVAEPKFANHSSLAAVHDAFGGPLAGYFVFCFERDPMDKMISFYFYERRRLGFSSFDEMLDAHHHCSDFDLYSIDGVIKADFVGRYENLSQDIGIALQRIGLECPVELPRLKSQFRPLDTQAENFLNSKQRARIGEIFEREYAHFDYARP